MNKYAYDTNPEIMEGKKALKINLTKKIIIIAIKMANFYSFFKIGVGIGHFVFSFF